MRQKMGNPSTKEALGLSVLSALSIAGLWSAVCPSYFTHRTFASQPEARGKAEEGCWLGFGLSSLGAGAIWLVFDEPLAAIIAEATAAALLGISLYALRQPPMQTVPSIEQQNV